MSEPDEVKWDLLQISIGNTSDLVGRTRDLKHKKKFALVILFIDLETKKVCKHEWIECDFAQIPISFGLVQLVWWPATDSYGRCFCCCSSVLVLTEVLMLEASCPLALLPALEPIILRPTIIIFFRSTTEEPMILVLLNWYHTVSNIVLSSTRIVLRQK